MSINWVMLDPAKGFVHLPNENRIWTSPPRTSLSITTPRTYPGNSPIIVQSSTGTIYLTNQRIVYLPTTSNPTLQSFSAPLLNLHDTHVTAPFFGPNVWYAVLQPVPGGGLNPSTNTTSVPPYIEVKMTFKDGGAYDFQMNFERLRERLREAVESARERNLTANATTPSVDYTNVHLEELPAYEAGPGGPPTNQSSATGLGTMTAHGPGGIDLPPAFDSRAATPSAPSPHHPPTTTTALAHPQPVKPSTIPTTLPPSISSSSSTRQHPDSSQSTPSDPPPGYEEVQQQSIVEEFERRLSAGANGGEGDNDQEDEGTRR